MKLIFILSFIIVITGGCFPCRNLDCVSPYDNLTFSYESKTGEDLLYGPTKAFALEDFKLYSIDKNNNKIQSDLNLSYSNASVINVYLQYYTERSFLEIKGVVTDTLDLKFRIEKTECCGTISSIIETRLDGTPQVPNTTVKIAERK